MIVGTFALACVAWLLGASSAIVAMATADILAFALAVLFAWLKFGRDILPGRAFLAIGPLILKKFQLYGRMVLGRSVTGWVRTDRGKLK